MKNISNCTWSLVAVFAAVAAVVLAASCKNNQNELPQRSEKEEISNSQKIDKRESVDAATDPSEEGLSQLDSAHKSEWQANGFPQTHRGLEELEKAENKNK
ncbi:hypothetical protein [Sinobaca sp. H24]|uniref:hypothetical protein n=1 Tax=Sinobaca sp. H24 TaxID=2923376 RepID=UPI00207A6712|nr:hypothetical protein [Sinobaca sp. H24]